MHKLKCTLKYLVLITLLVPSFINAIDLKVTHQVYFDIAIDGKEVGRMEIGLFGEDVPKTVQNFYTIATEGGDILNENGKGSVSIYGKRFDDEDFNINHTGPGLLSMANAGPNSNGCQFFITTIQTPWLDGKHVVFGKVTKGQALVHTIEQVKTDSEDFPLQTVEIISSGSIPTPKPFYTTAENSYTLWTWITAGSVPLSFSFAILLFFQWVIYKLDHVKIKED